VRKKLARGQTWNILSFVLRRQTVFGEPTHGVFDSATDRFCRSLRRFPVSQRCKHTERRGIPVSERGLVPRENTAFLARREVSCNDGCGVV